MHGYSNNDLKQDFFVKFQKKDIETAFHKELLDSAYTGNNSFGDTYREHKEALEFSEKQLKELFDYSAEIGVLCFATPFDISSVDTTQSFIVVTGRTDDTGAGEHHDGWMSARFINSTAVIVQRGTTANNAVASWQVVEWPGASVQNGEIITPKIFPGQMRITTQAQLIEALRSFPPEAARGISRRELIRQLVAQISPPASQLPPGEIIDIQVVDIAERPEIGRWVADVEGEFVEVDGLRS